MKFFVCGTQTVFFIYKNFEAFQQAPWFKLTGFSNLKIFTHDIEGHNKF